MSRPSTTMPRPPENPPTTSAAMISALHPPQHRARLEVGRDGRHRGSSRSRSGAGADTSSPSKSTSGLSGSRTISTFIVSAIATTSSALREIDALAHARQGRDAVRRARVEVRKAKPARHLPRDRGLADAGRTVDRDDDSRHDAATSQPSAWRALTSASARDARTLDAHETDGLRAASARSRDPRR